MSRNIATAISAVITFLVGGVLNLLKTKLGLSIDNSMRASFQTAATNAAGLVLNSLVTRSRTRKLRLAISPSLVNYVLKAASNAVEHLDLAPGAIAQKGLPKLYHLGRLSGTCAARLAPALQGPCSGNGLVILAVVYSPLFAYA